MVAIKSSMATFNENIFVLERYRYKQGKHTYAKFISPLFNKQNTKNQKQNTEQIDGTHKLWSFEGILILWKWSCSSSTAGGSLLQYLVIPEEINYKFKLLSDRLCESSPSRALHYLLQPALPASDRVCHGRLSYSHDCNLRTQFQGKLVEFCRDLNLMIR
ncbi:hypothetical protein H5410_057962 [Solanum commersonii]|uniref:Uncharacterized protein n=1 Tax=Solanum commersonii TaxID=4109 RepID=A0A9J5WRQ4_SOLCO|nr:hypothetical protein H5410_057962 [Solanum commersonii]